MSPGDIDLSSISVDDAVKVSNADLLYGSSEEEVKC